VVVQIFPVMITVADPIEPFIAGHAGKNLKELRTRLGITTSGELPNKGHQYRVDTRLVVRNSTLRNSGA
jgi:hypothetical protein